MIPDSNDGREAFKYLSGLHLIKPAVCKYLQNYKQYLFWLTAHTILLSYSALYCKNVI